MEAKLLATGILIILLVVLVKWIIDIIFIYPEMNRRKKDIDKVIDNYREFGKWPWEE